MTYIRPDWHDNALCAGMDTNLFFPTHGQSNKTITAIKAICQSCPVQTPCLTYAVETIEPFGIWGGTTERQRRILRKKTA